METLLTMSSALHCAEVEADEVASSEAPGPWVPPPSPFYDGHCPISDLLSAELEHAPRPGYLDRLRDGSLDPAARRDAINWILKVHAFYRFRPTTALLSVNYLDRFLSSQAPPKGVGWPWQLLSVACLSVAAKMEETDAPPLLDLQVLEPRFVFDPRTVQRMELLLMAVLRWRMRPVTPFDFVGHFAGLLPLVTFRGGQRREGLLSRVSELILGTQRVEEFLGYRPSAIAATAVLCAAVGEGDDLSRFYDVVGKDAVDGCRRLMGEYLLDKGKCRLSGAPPPEPEQEPELKPPPSPVGVLDAATCASCDTQISSAGAADPDPEAGATEPPAMRRRRPPAPSA